MKLIVGLGNPGEKYLLTPHNIGWIFIDALAHFFNIKLQSKKKFSAEIALTEDKKVIFLKPLTYMNLSGKAVKSVMNFYNINLEDLLVIHDDTDLPFLSLRFQKNRGPAGHNGLKNINEELASQNYTRLRIGMQAFIEQEYQKETHSTSTQDQAKVSDEDENKKENWLSSLPPINPLLLTNHPSPQLTRLVLKPFTKKEQALLPDFLNKTIEAIEYFLSEGLEKSANRYNSESSQKK